MNENVSAMMIVLGAALTMGFALRYRREETLRMMGREAKGLLADEARRAARLSALRWLLLCGGVFAVAPMGADLVQRLDAPGTVTTVLDDLLRVPSGDQTGSVSDGVSMGDGAAYAGVTPWFEETWDYSSYANLHSNPNGWLERNPSNADSMLFFTGIGQSWGDEAVGDTLKSGEDSGNGAAVDGFDLVFPAAATDSLREIWIEFYWRTSSDWATNQSGDGNPDHKTFLVTDQNSSIRWSFKIGNQSGTGIACYTATDGASGPALQTTNLDAPNDAWDGSWHQIRLHYKMASTNGGTDGQIDCWFDGTLYRSGTVSSNQLDTEYFEEIQIGRTFNQAIATGSIWHQYGRIRVFDIDPGWS